MFNRSRTVEKPSTELFLDSVLERVDCRKHKVPTGVPCFHIYKTTGGYFPAVCNKRAVRAGFNAPIRPESLRLNRAPKKK